jgi:type I restriction enzyme S subunit
VTEAAQNLEGLSAPTNKAKYRTYPAYRDSGIEWLGKVPEGWEIKRLKFTSDLLNGYAFDSNDYVDNGIPIIRIGDVGCTIDWESIKKVPEYFLKSLARFKIFNGDILLALTGATIGKSSVYNSDTVALLNQRVGIIRSVNLNQTYLKYFISSELFSEVINYLCYGGAQENIGKDGVGNIAVTLPPITDQHSIANVLDEQTTKINALIQKVQIAIGKLKEYRTALISAAVTGKIDVRGFIGWEVTCQ